MLCIESSPFPRTRKSLAVCLAKKVMSLFFFILYYIRIFCAFGKPCSQSQTLPHHEARVLPEPPTAD